MRSTCMMLFGLTGLLAYSAYSAMDPVATIHDSLPLNESVLVNDSAADQTAQPERLHEAGKLAAEPIGVGSTRDQVAALWGQPTSIDMDNDRWTYGGTLLMFKNDRVAGMMPLSGKQIVNLQNASETAKPARGSTRCVAAKSASYTPYASKSRTQSRSNQHYWEPMFRLFYSSQPLPRGQSHLSPRWMGVSVYQETYFQRLYRR